MRRAPRKDPGSGVLLGAEEANASLTGFEADLKHLADSNKIPFATDYSAAVISSGYLPAPPLPQKFGRIGVATAWADSPAETINSADFAALVNLLEAYLQATGKSPLNLAQSLPASSSPRDMKAAANTSAATDVLEHLTEAYGVSNHEERIRDTIKPLLPPWAKPETDNAGNLIVRVGTAAAGSNTPRILIVAHMDEIGFEVKSIAKDGTPRSRMARRRRAKLLLRPPSSCSHRHRGSRRSRRASAELGHAQIPVALG